MSDTVQLALIALITTAGGGVVTLITAWMKRTTESLEHITTLTNSTLSAAVKRIDELELIISALRTSAAHTESEASDLVIARALIAAQSLLDVASRTAAQLVNTQHAKAAPPPDA